jgi:hypothetical protein
MQSVSVITASMFLAEAVRPGLNQLAFRSARMVRIRDGSESFPAMPPEEEVAFRLWYVSIVPR